jgi:peptidyl-prolyl cis-trans isomerase C
MRVRQPVVLPVALLALLALFSMACSGSGGGPAAPAPQAAAPVEPPSPEEIAARNVVIAEVNGAPVRAWQLDEAVAVTLGQFEASGIQLQEDDAKRHRRATLEAIIGNELLYQAAVAEGISADPQQVDLRIEQARTRFQTEQEYDNYLTAAGITEEEVRDQASYQLTVQSYIESLTRELAVDEGEVRKAYDANRESFKEPPQVRAAFILIKSSPDDPEAQRADARRRIEEAFDRVQKGEDFGQLAREYSQAAAAAKGGDVGFFKRGEGMVPQFEDAAFSLGVGEVSEIFETAFGFNILKVLDRKEERQLEFDEVKPSLMLMYSEQQHKSTVSERIESLRAEATVEILDEELKATSAVVTKSQDS